MNKHLPGVRPRSVQLTPERREDLGRRANGRVVPRQEVVRARFIAHTGPTRKADDLMAFMEELALQHPTGNVYIVWDNLNIHKDGPSDRWTAFNARHGGRFRFLYTPIHASWVNQVESWFAILQKRVLRHGVFDNIAALNAQVVGFIAHWNAGRHPFRWKFEGYPLEARESAA